MNYYRQADIMDFTGTHDNAILHWLGEHGKANQETNREELFQQIKKYYEALTKGEYIDTHNWKFTPDNFGYIVDLLNKFEKS